MSQLLSWGSPIRARMRGGGGEEKEQAVRVVLSTRFRKEEEGRRGEAIISANYRGEEREREREGERERERA